MKCEEIASLPEDESRSPHGERGLKLDVDAALVTMTQSLPSRGAWIEIKILPLRRSMYICRSPHGERGLKSAGEPGGHPAHQVAPLTGSGD